MKNFSLWKIKIKFGNYSDYSYICKQNEKDKVMETNNQRVYVTLPDSDISFLRTISRKMGWSVKREQKSGIEKGLEDIQAGRVYHAKNSEDLIKQILG